ncbi:hypothetical protein [Mesobacillus jeotgali]|uniref:hypothetical protein n=1 Tax=Mesobacillus jeotgali TaxID=129985 RepID=UPI0009A7689B|nr:hypothetical protein [Mesobacillus jeotgali]
MTKKKPMSRKQALAYKTQQEGKAVLVTAWMPAILLVAGAGILFLFLHTGVDLSQLAPLAEIISALAL